MGGEEEEESWRREKEEEGVGSEEEEAAVVSPTSSVTGVCNRETPRLPAESTFRFITKKGSMTESV